LLQPTLQMLAFAPAVLLIRRNDRTSGRILLEWSALITAALAISTSPASYHFVLMVFPVCVLAATLLDRKWYGWLAALLVVYLGIGFPMPSPGRMMGPAILFYVPRLPLMLALLLGMYLLLWRDRPVESSLRDWTQSANDFAHPTWDWTHHAWAAAMVVTAILGVRSTLHLQRAVRQEFAYRLPLQTEAFLHAGPASAGAQVRYIAFTMNGYHLTAGDTNTAWVFPSPGDDLSFTGNAATVWVEKALSPQSEAVDLQHPTHAVLNDAHDPMLSADGQSIAFVRDDHGRGRLMVRRAFGSGTASEAALTPLPLHVYEASFVSEKQYAFSAVEDGRPPQIYLTNAAHSNAPLGLGESRYPALSPDGAWLAYSHLEHGMWNLFVRDQRTGAIRRIADVPCNQIQPAWEEDSTTLLYGTDCGRSLWFTAVARRSVIRSVIP
jgi:hypothetical protein